jgi:hypothetical protein
MSLSVKYLQKLLTQQKIVGSNLASVYGFLDFIHCYAGFGVICIVVLYL